MGKVNCDDKKIVPKLFRKLGDRKCASQILNLNYYHYTFGIFPELFLYHSDLAIQSGRRVEILLLYMYK